MAQNGSSDSNYAYRLAVAMNLADWNSGLSGGLWASGGLGSVGNNNSTITSGELRWKETILSSNLSQSTNIWLDYVNWMISSSRDDFRYYYGLKTVVDFLIDQRATESETPEFASTPLQPMQAIKEGVNLLTGILENLDAADQVSLETFSVTGVHRMDLTEDYAAVAATFAAIHPDGGTNIGAGMALATNELTSSRARAVSRKLMVVLTDGYANYDQYGNFNETTARTYVLSQAEYAASHNIEILSISVGQNADDELMAEIAEVGSGVYFKAAGTPEEYTAQLQEIFGQIAGHKTVQLIQ
jgi:hypothetical protein